MKFVKHTLCLLALLLALCLVFTGCELVQTNQESDNLGGQGTVNQTQATTDATQDTSSTQSTEPQNSSTDLTQSAVQEQRQAEKALGIPKYSGTPYAALNGNVPQFKDDEITVQSYEFYSELDSLGRCGYVMASIGKDLMPAQNEERGDIDSVKPSGWVNNKYDKELVSGSYIYNRSHLIGWQLTAENANKKNLITGTRYMNVDGMLPFENMVADYIKETNNHVMYRVTPIYDGNDLVACGVQMEAYSVEDNGEGISFNVYIYNIQPGIVIDYATGNNWLATEVPETDKATQKTTDDTSAAEGSYVLNTNSKKIHKPTCRSVSSISEGNKQEYTGSMQDLIDDGYSACGICKPAA